MSALDTAELQTPAAQQRVDEAVSNLAALSEQLRAGAGTVAAEVAGARVELDVARQILEEARQADVAVQVRLTAEQRAAAEAAAVATYQTSAPLVGSAAQAALDALGALIDACRAHASQTDAALQSVMDLAGPAEQMELRRWKLAGRQLHEANPHVIVSAVVSQALKAAGAAKSGLYLDDGSAEVLRPFLTQV